MKAINLLSAFYLCSLLIFSANGMEKKNKQLGLAESVRIMPSDKPGQKGWFQGLTDYYICGYNNNTEAALNAYLNKDVLHKDHRKAALDYTTWGTEEETVKISLKISEIKPYLTNKDAFPVKAFSEITTTTNYLKLLMKGTKKHELVLPQNTKKNAYTILQNVQDIMPLITSIIAQQSLNLCKEITDINEMITGEEEKKIFKGTFFKQVSSKVVSPYQTNKKKK